ncbi:phosphatidylserine decarboxylase [Thalassomonas sp. RHCl1]|uniref:phosphatidylserine decarboxylase n=1 Tax=Thalassomonas sp. RHCl1 TaxID=2995320 RepID=UPI00248AC30B|nr:phosphatidylserine decarboxylase [Thalassomonas sp. RHCl1]
MSNITPITLPTPIEWSTKVAAAEQHIEQLDEVFNQNPVNKASYIGALAEVYSEKNIPEREEVASYWQPYLYREPEYTLKHFFLQWLTYTPTPANPGKYIEYWDYLVNTTSGLMLANDKYFKPWFRQFLNFHGDWINSTSSTITLSEWVKYKGTAAHPFNIDNYEQPDPNSPTGGFLSFNQFFLRNLKPGQRPLCCAQPAGDVIVAPCDGGVFYLTRGGVRDNTEHTPGNGYLLPGKSGDRFDLLEAIPGYGRHFLGGALLDILLWFTDYHHFHAPVSGTVIDQGLYEGSYNYDFDDYNPKDHYAPSLPGDSDKVGWYKKLGKHQRYVWVIKTENLGLVAMIAIGFWGVGSIINAVDNGATLEKGQYMGHFGYGGSSIVLAFEPDLEVQFKIGDQPVRDANHPVLMEVRQCLGKGTEVLNW